MAGNWTGLDLNPELPLTLHQDKSVPDGLGWGRVPEYVRPQGGMKQGTLPGVVLIILNETGQPEVGDLAHQPLPHKDVGCPQVTVDVVHALHVGHALSYLGPRYGEMGTAWLCDSTFEKPTFQTRTLRLRDSQFLPQFAQLMQWVGLRVQG